MTVKHRDFYTPKEELGHRASGPESKHQAPPGGNHDNPKSGAIRFWMENIWPSPLQHHEDTSSKAQGSSRTLHSSKGGCPDSQPMLTRKGHAL